MNRTITFGAEITTAHPLFPNFEVPPKLNVKLERFNEDTNAYTSVWEKTLDSEVANNRISFKIVQSLKGLDSGNYRYRYRLDGVLKMVGIFRLTARCLLLGLNPIRTIPGNFGFARLFFCLLCCACSAR